MSIEIKKLSTDDGINIYNMLKTIPANENGFVNSASEKSYDEYKKWLISANDNSLQDGIIDGWKIPQTTYWLFENGEPVGYGKIRHFMTEQLLIDGGNVGYAIVPTARNRGLGTIFLKLLINESIELGLKQILLTIQKENTASIKVALANGGIIEKTDKNLTYILINLK